MYQLAVRLFPLNPHYGDKHLESQFATLPPDQVNGWTKKWRAVCFCVCLRLNCEAALTLHTMLYIYIYMWYTYTSSSTPALWPHISSWPRRLSKVSVLNGPTSGIGAAKLMEFEVSCPCLLSLFPDCHKDLSKVRRF